MWLINIMLRSTFLHLKGVGRKSEKALWAKGCATWEGYAAAFQHQYSLFGSTASESVLDDSLSAYRRGDMAFFANLLPTAEYYRVALEFPQDVIFVDIETTGFSFHSDMITIVGWSIGSQYGVYINGRDETLLRTALSKAKVIVTFNGTLFDLKIMDNHFDALSIPPVHIDLRFFAKRVGLSGGQKAIEKKLGFRRQSHIEGMSGDAAPILWHQYRRGNLGALRRLIEYNHADIEGMKRILDVSIERYMEQESIPANIRKKAEFINQSTQIAWADEKSDIPTSLETSIPDFSGNSGDTAA